MKYYFFCFLIIGFFTNGTAQNWETNFVQSTQKAKEENKPIVVVFQGSDWCAPCIKLDKEIWSSKVFMTYSNENLIMFKADFPRKKANKLSKELQEQNSSLAEKYNMNGYFPYVVVLNSEGKIYGSFGYEKQGPDDYIKLIESLIK